MNRPAIVLLGLAMMGAALPALAQTHRDSAPPASGASDTSLPRYSSAFEGYRPFREETPNRWRELNETVGQVGGHAGVLKAGAAAAPPAAAQPAAKSPHSIVPATEHGRHGKH